MMFPCLHSLVFTLTRSEWKKSSNFVSFPQRVNGVTIVDLVINSPHYDSGQKEVMFCSLHLSNSSYLVRICIL